MADGSSLISHQNLLISHLIFRSMIYPFQHLFHILSGNFFFLNSASFLNRIDSPIWHLFVLISEHNTRCRLLHILLQLKIFIGVRYYEMFKDIMTIVVIHISLTNLSKSHEIFKLF